MTEVADLVRTTLDPLLRTHASEERVRAAENGWDTELWDQLDKTGFTAIGTSEEDGGSGGDLEIACGIVRAAARHAAPVPLAEALVVAPWIRARCGFDFRPGPTAVGIADHGDVRFHSGGGRLVDGVCRGVAWGRASNRVLLLIVADATVRVIDLPRDAVDVDPGTNLAGEPADLLAFRDVDTEALPTATVGLDVLEGTRLRGSLARTVMMSGAIDAVLNLTCGYVGDREQFGAPIARFQAVRHQLAELAGEAAVARAAARGAVAAIEAGEPLGAIAARVRVSQAAGNAARIAHQMHGAMGFTREHTLHLYTRRLWAWRDEYGTQAEWQLELGRRLLAQGGDGLWAMVTERGLVASAVSGNTEHGERR